MTIKWRCFENIK